MKSLQHKYSFHLIPSPIKECWWPKNKNQLKEGQIPTTQPFIKQCMILAEEEHRKQLTKPQYAYYTLSFFSTKNCTADSIK
jgi:hypothetical protein